MLRTKLGAASAVVLKCEREAGSSKVGLCEACLEDFEQEGWQPKGYSGMLGVLAGKSDITWSRSYR